MKNIELTFWHYTDMNRSINHEVFSVYSLFLFFRLIWMVSSFTLPQRPTRSHHVRLSSTHWDFDFSSKIGWNQFYKEETDAVEWHSSIPLDVLVKAYITKEGSCLMIGCGTSQLPRAIYDADGTAAAMTCLDSSSTCLDQLKQQFDSVNDDDASIQYVCGDAVELTQTLGDVTSFDVIVDKGLMDALLCDEGWNGPVERLMEQAIRRLKVGGQYLLVSYGLPSSTQDFLVSVTTPHLEWEFDRPEAAGRVQVSLATKVKKQDS